MLIMTLLRRLNRTQSLLARPLEPGHGEYRWTGTRWLFNVLKILVFSLNFLFCDLDVVRNESFQNILIFFLKLYLYP